MVIAKQDITIFRIVEVDDITRYYTFNDNWPSKPTTNPPSDEWSETEPNTSFEGSASGTSLAITDISPIEHNLDVKLRSKNLLPYPYPKTTNTVNGITFTANGDGTVTVNGTATNVAEFSLGWANYDLLTKGEKYYISGAPTTDNSVYFVLNLYNHTGSGNTYAQSFAANNVIDTSAITKTWNNVALSIVVRKGVTVSNMVVKPMLEHATTPSAYTPYVKDLSSVKMVTKGKNLIPYPYATTSKTENGIRFTDNGDGTITANGTATADAAFKCQTFVDVDNILPSGNYFVSGCPQNGSNTTYFINFAFRYNNVSFSDVRETGAGVLINAPNGIEKVYAVIRIKSGTTVENLTFKPQLERGSVASKYEPYVAPTTYTPSADGTVANVKSIYPSTLLSTDTDGVIIDAEYSKDLSKSLYFTDLTTYTDDTFKYSEVSKSSDYEAAKEAYTKTIAAEYKADTVETRIINAETSIEQNKEAIALRATKTELQSEITSRKFGNLLKNGYGEYLDNTNLPESTFHRGDSPDGTYGYFTGTGWSADTSTFTEPILFNKNLVYDFEFYRRVAKSATKTTAYFSIIPYDVDGNIIATNQVLGWKKTLFYLSQDLNDGDTVAHFTDLSEWSDVDSGWYRNFTIFGYTDSTGYTYPDGTYSRNVYSNVYADNSSVDKVNNTITLSAAWSGGTVKAGTAIGRGVSGATWIYLGVNGTITHTEWLKQTGTFQANNNSTDGLRLAVTRYIKVCPVGWSSNYAGMYIGIHTVDKDARQGVETANGKINDVQNQTKVLSKTISDNYAALETNANKISASVESLKTTVTEDIDGLNQDISSLRQKVDLQLTEDSVDIQIEKKLQNGVTKVDTTTGFTFDENGLNISKTDSPTNTQITENGMTVNKTETGDAVLTANKDGVDAVNLRATTYLIVGKRSRFEDYEPGRTGCFWIGE